MNNTMNRINDSYAIESIQMSEQMDKGFTSR